MKKMCSYSNLCYIIRVMSEAILKSHVNLTPIQLLIIHGKEHMWLWISLVNYIISSFIFCRGSAEVEMFLTSISISLLSDWVISWGYRSLCLVISVHRKGMEEGILSFFPKEDIHTTDIIWEQCWSPYHCSKRAAHPCEHWLWFLGCHCVTTESPSSVCILWPSVSPGTPDG